VKQSDDVFFFTLIDFLVQVFFFGLLLFVVSQTASAKKEIQHAQESQQLESVMKKAGVSNITELQDYLTKLAPLENLRGTADFINRLGGPKKVEEAMAVVAASGGLEEIKVKVKKYNEAYGLPPCLKDEVNGRTIPRTLAVLRVEDSAIEIIQMSPDLNRLLTEAGLSTLGLQRMSLDDFRSKFSPLKAHSPSCAHFVEVKVATQFINPMRAVWANFRVK
jgi:hypothetical protein